MSIREAASGSTLDLLVALRDLIASELDKGVPARELAACAKRLLEIAREIRALDASTGGVVAVAAATPDESWAVAARG